jgi:hypothetical protein
MIASAILSNGRTAKANGGGTVRIHILGPSVYVVENEHTMFQRTLLLWLLRARSLLHVTVTVCTCRTWLRSRLGTPIIQALRSHMQSEVAAISEDAVGHGSAEHKIIGQLEENYILGMFKKGKV